MESTTFLSGFSNYYSVLTGEGELPVSSESDFGVLKDEWTEVSSGTEYLDYFGSISTLQEEPNAQTFTFHALDVSDNVAPIITNTCDSYNSTDFFTFNVEDTPIAPSILDLDYLNDSCPFDWDLNLENLLTTKSEVLPDLCNDICKELSEESVPASPSLQPPNGQSDAEGKPPFQCTYEQCRKVYAKAAHLRQHIRRHLGHKPYVCTWLNCQWRFNRSDELARHRRSHSGLKPYHCDYCQKSFSRSDHLTKHRKVHERKFASGKAKGVWRVLPKAKPGRKPKSMKQSGD